MASKSETNCGSFEGHDMIEAFRTVALHAMKEQIVQSDIERKDQEIIDLREKNKHLKAQVKELQISLEGNVEDRERVIELKSNTIDELQKKINNIQKTINQDRVELAKKYLTKFKESEQEKNELLKKLKSYELKLEVLSNFDRMKELLDAKIKDLKSEMIEQKQIHEEEMRKIEQRMMSESARSKSEKEKEINSYKEEMKVLLKTRLNETTRTTIEENAQLQLEIQYQSKKIHELIDEGNKLRVDKRELSQTLEVQQEMQLRLSKKVKFFERLFKKMQMKEVQEKESAILEELPFFTISSTSLEPQSASSNLVSSTNIEMFPSSEKIVIPSPVKEVESPRKPKEKTSFRPFRKNVTSTISTSMGAQIMQRKKKLTLEFQQFLQDSMEQNKVWSQK